MASISRLASSRELIPRHDGLPQKSFTYTIGRKKLHMLGDGWAFNHDGSLAGTPIQDIQLELAIAFESVVSAAGTRTYNTGEFRVLGADVQKHYFTEWAKLKRKERQAGPR